MQQLFGNGTARCLPMRIFPLLCGLSLIALAPFAQAADTCIAHPYLLAERDDEKALVALYQEIAPVLERFPSLSEALTREAPELCFSSIMDGAHAYLDIDENRIVLSEGLSKDMQTAVLVHELRHLEQFVWGACPSNDLAMQEYARATFAIEADASAISLLIAWDMKENGNGAIWGALASWPSQHDIAESFANEMTDTGDIALAVTAAFNQWYASPTRRDQYYFSACSGYLDSQDETHTLPLYHLIPETFLEQLCKLPDGSRYECAHPDIKRH